MIALLPRLQTLKLEDLAAPLSCISDLSKVSSLRNLQIDSIIEGTYDFQLCTQMTNLHFGASHDGSNTILLPQDDAVHSNIMSLRTFKLTAVNCTVSNLAFATELRVIDMSPTAFANSHIEWPIGLPRLEEFRDAMENYGHPVSRLPDEWLGYSNLTHISLNTFTASDLPVWFTGLQNLRTLQLNYAELRQFPTCLARLSGLENLSLLGLETYLSSAILDLADLPRLQELSFGNLVRCSRAEKVHLQQLEFFCCARALDGMTMLLRHDGGEDDWDFFAPSRCDITPDAIARLKGVLSVAQDEGWGPRAPE